MSGIQITTPPTVTASGGNNGEDSGKAALFDSFGRLNTTIGLLITDNSLDYTSLLTAAAMNASRTWTLPDRTGNIALTDGVGTPVVLQLAASDETTDLTTGTAKVTLRMPFAMTLTAVRASVNTAPTGSALVVDINENGASVLSTKLSIDATEKTSTTAASAAVISDTSLADDAEVTIDIDTIGSTLPGKGLKVTLIGTRA